MSLGLPTILGEWSWKFTLSILIWRFFISFQNSPFSLLTQSNQIDENTFCNPKSLPSRCQNQTHCFCLHRYKVPLNSIVWMRVTDESPGGEQFSFTHPFHVHGHQFLVIDMGSQPGNSTGLDNMYPAFKDTVVVPGQGFVVIKFKANNPGFWLMHCHFEWHLGMGMSMVLQVGELDEMVQPPVGFPRCNNYQPPIQP
jgi:Multicopper oxidase